MRPVWLRVIVAILASLISIGASAPVYARLLGGPAEHRCHCVAREGHASCACPICLKQLTSPDEGLAMKGTCGDDDPIWPDDADDAAVPATSLIVLAAPVRVVVSFARAPAPPRWTAAPEPRPPRATRAA